MRAFEIFLNSKRLCVAGVGIDGYVSTYITWHSEPPAMWIDVVGGKSRKKVYVRWAKQDLVAGDEISVRVVDRKSADKGKKIGTMNLKRDVRALKQHTRMPAKRFGWTINERPKHRP